MVDPTPENFTKLVDDVEGLKGEVHAMSSGVCAVGHKVDLLGENIKGFERSQNTLKWAVGVVGALFGVMLAIGSAQISGLDTRVDGVVGGLAGVREELGEVKGRLTAAEGQLDAINKSLEVLPEIRDRLEDLASIQPSIDDSSIASSLRKALSFAGSPGAPFFVSTIYRGAVDPVGLKALLETYSDKRPKDLLVGAKSFHGETALLWGWYMHGAWKPEGEKMLASMAPPFSAVSFGEFSEMLEKLPVPAELDTENGVLIISTDDGALRAVATEHGVDF